MRPHTLTCTFCKKTEHQVRKLVAGPGVYICDACVETARRIITDSDTRAPRGSWRSRVVCWVAARLESLGRRWTARQTEQPA